MVQAEDQLFQFVQAEPEGVTYHDLSSKGLKTLALDSLALASLLYRIPKGYKGLTIDLLNDEHVKTQNAGTTKLRKSRRKLTIMQPAESWADVVGDYSDVLQKCSMVKIFIEYKDNMMLVAKYNGKCIGKPHPTPGTSEGISGTEVMIVAFRGTNSVDDLFTDLKFRPCKFNPQIETMMCMCGSGKIKVHKGFAMSLKKVNAGLDGYLKDSYFKGPVLFTGHSKGGAVSQLAAVQTALQLENLKSITGVGCITFGCPHVGNQAFCDEYNKHVQVRVHVMQGRDPIVHLPPLTLHPFREYSAVGNVYHVGPKPESTPSWQWNPKYLPDHHPDWYKYYMQEKRDENHMQTGELLERWKPILKETFNANFCWKRTQIRMDATCPIDEDASTDNKA